MADYNKSTNFTAKDSLPTGNSGKIVKGTEIDTELNAIANAIASKADINSPNLTGTPTAPTATVGSNTTQLANTAFVKNAVDTATAPLGTISTQNANAVAITGGTINGVTGTASGLTVGNATNATNATSATNATTATNANQFQGKTKLGLGITGEVWNNVTGSRSFNTTYTNSYSYPIVVSASTNGMGLGTSQQLLGYVNGQLVSYWKWQFNGAGAIGGVVMIVPPGATYSCNCDPVGVQNWVELY